MLPLLAQTFEQNLAALAPVVDSKLELQNGQVLLIVLTLRGVLLALAAQDLLQYNSRSKRSDLLISPRSFDALLPQNTHEIVVSKLLSKILL